MRDAAKVRLWNDICLHRKVIREEIERIRRSGERYHNGRLLGRGEAPNGGGVRPSPSPQVAGKTSTN